MPGITGFISCGLALKHLTVVESMVTCMLHDPAYRSGVFVEQAMGVAAGWVCHPHSFADCLPIWNESKDVCLIFTGEHFGDKGDIERLRARGHSCVVGNANSLVHEYEEHGIAFLKKLNGIFSGLVIDLRERKIVLFNDRYGLGRIYFYESSEGFYFASEAKSLLKVLPQLRKLDMRSLGEYFSCGCPLRNRTLFEGVSLLPPGSAWTFRLQEQVKRQTYFDKADWENQEGLPVAEFYEELKDTFIRIVPKYFSGDRPISLSLTGGIDSRMVIAANPRPASQLPCYSVRGIYRECADARLGRRIATVCGHRHQVITVDRKFFSAFPELAMQTVYYTDGAMNPVGSAGLYANRLARDLAPVRMTGNYGGEVLRGIVAFKAGESDGDLLSDGFLPFYREAVTTFAEERSIPRASFILFKQMPWHHYARFAMESSQLTIRSPFLDNELVRLAYRAPGDAAANKALAHRLIADCNPKLQGVPTDRGRVRRPSIVPSKVWDWCKEFFPRAEYVYDYGMPDWLAKVDRVLGPLRMERAFLGSQKYCHFRTWYRHELAPFVQEVLLDPRTLARPYLNRRRVEQGVRAHVNGRGNFTLKIHKLLATEFIERKLISMD